MRAQLLTRCDNTCCQHSVYTLPHMCITSASRAEPFPEPRAKHTAPTSPGAGPKFSRHLQMGFQSPGRPPSWAQSMVYLSS